MNQIASITLLILSFVLTLVTFQNCSSTKFSTSNLGISSNIPLESDPIGVVYPQVCSSENSVVAKIILDDRYEYGCTDETFQALNVGPICSSGPAVTAVSNFRNEVDCRDNLHICGVLPNDLKTVKISQFLTEHTFEFSNLPMGCQGKVSMSSYRENGLKLQEQSLIINVPKAACNSCADSTQTCGTCPDAVTYSWTSSVYGSCSATPSYTYGAWSSCSSGQQTRSATCSNTSGTKSRSVVCNDSTGRTVADSFCSAAGVKPSASTSCTNSCSGTALTLQTCVVPVTYNWSSSTYGSCNATPSYTYGTWSNCSSGQQTRSSTCANTTGTKSRSVVCNDSTGRTVADSFCSAVGAKPAASTSCTNSCSGTALTSQACSEPGVCGSSHGTKIVVAPTTGLCNSTFGSSVPISSGNTFAWSCNGTGIGGQAASCVANKPTCTNVLPSTVTYNLTDGDGQIYPYTENLSTWSSSQYSTWKSEYSLGDIMVIKSTWGCDPQLMRLSCGMSGWSFVSIQSTHTCHN